MQFWPIKINKDFIIYFTGIFELEKMFSDTTFALQYNLIY